MIEIRGAEQLAALSKKLKAAGNRELQQELSHGILQAVKPVITAARESARSTLPRRGGLAARVANSSIRTMSPGGARFSGVRLQAKNQYSLGRLDRGINRHPVYGNRRVWVTQKVTPGWWTKPTKEAAPQARAQVEQAMQRVANKI